MITELVAFHDSSGQLRFHCGPSGSFDAQVDPHHCGTVVRILRFEGPLVEVWPVQKTEGAAAGAEQVLLVAPESRQGIDQIRRIAIEAERIGLDAEDLDEHVIESKCAEASDINNAGRHDQIAYLVTALGPEEARRIVNAGRTHGGRS